MSGPTYRYTDVAARIEAVLGVRPSLTTLRAAAAEQTRTGLAPRHDRITAGMPRPLATPPGAAAEFDQEAIDTWLSGHPRRRRAQAEEAAVAALSAGSPEVVVVSNARAAGVRWARIVEILVDHDGRRRTIAGVAGFYHRRSID